MKCLFIELKRCIFVPMLLKPKCVWKALLHNIRVNMHMLYNFILIFFSNGSCTYAKTKRLFHVDKLLSISIKIVKFQSQVTPLLFPSIWSHHESVPLFTSEKNFTTHKKRVKRILYAENLALEVEIVFCESIPLGTASGIFSKNYLRRKKSSLLALFLDSI